MNLKGLEVGDIYNKETENGVEKREVTKIEENKEGKIINVQSKKVKQ